MNSIWKKMKNVTDFFFYILYVPDIVQYVQKGVYVTYTSQASKETASQYIIPVEGGCPEYAYCPQIMVIVGSGQRKTDEKVPPPLHLHVIEGSSETRVHCIRFVYGELNERSKVK